MRINNYVIMDNSVTSVYSTERPMVTPYDIIEFGQHQFGWWPGHVNCTFYHGHGQIFDLSQ